MSVPPVLAAAGVLAATPTLHALAFPPARLHLLAWVAFVPWFVAIRRARSGRTAVALTWGTTLLGSWLVADWLPRGVAGYWGQPLAVGAMLFVGVWALTIAPWVAAFTLAYRALAGAAPAAAALWAGAAWTAGELVRTRLPPGDPFGLLGYSQAGVLPMVQIAEVTGVFGVSFAIATVNAALAEAWLARRAVRGARGALGVAAALVVAVGGYGALRLAAWPAPDTAATRVAVAQANLDLGTQWREEFYGRNLEAYMRLTHEAIRHDAPPLVFWPESAMTFFVETEPLYRAALARLLEPAGVELVTGGPAVQGGDAPAYLNSAFVLSPAGEVRGRYDKRQLLPFAEYFPLGTTGLLRRQFGRVREFTPGGAARLLPTAAGAAGVTICNEIMFGEIAGARVAAGAEYLVVLTNDSWIGQTDFAEQAFDMARLRAVEQRRWLVRASTSGPSAVVDPVGRIVAATAPESRAVATAAIHPRRARTLYAVVGDAFGLACVLLVAGAVIRRVVSSRRR